MRTSADGRYRHDRPCCFHRQPRVDDAEIKQLVEEKVELFWKGIESGANKRGQV